MDPNMDSRAVDTLLSANRIIEMDEFKRWQFPAYILVWAVEFAICVWAGFMIFGR